MRKTVAEIEREYDPDADWAKYEEWAAANHDNAVVLVTKKILLALFAMRDELLARDAIPDENTIKIMTESINACWEHGEINDRVITEQQRMHRRRADDLALNITRNTASLVVARAELIAWERIAARTQAAEAVGEGE